jgi:iron-sulfur cluster assembly protein
MIPDLNLELAIPRHQVNKMTIKLTQTAADHVRHFIDRHQNGVGLRLGVKPTGCSGWAYTVGVAENFNDEDQVFESLGIQVAVDPDAIKLIDGTELDFVTQGINRVFVFDNPNVTDECGCGESFTIEV